MMAMTLTDAHLRDNVYVTLGFSAPHHWTQNRNCQDKPYLRRVPYSIYLKQISPANHALIKRCRNVSRDQFVSPYLGGRLFEHV